MSERNDRGAFGGNERGQADGRSDGANGRGSSQGGESSAGGRSGKSNRGFASMSPDRQREIASKGGRAAHEKGTAHEWTADEARQAGRKGGETVSKDRAHMAAIGREGGGARGARRNTPQSNEAIRADGDGRASE
jgi:general stress protein YciG